MPSAGRRLPRAAAGEIANVEEKHGWLLEIMRKELSDILVARTLGR